MSKLECTDCHNLFHKQETVEYGGYIFCIKDFKFRINKHVRSEEKRNEIFANVGLFSEAVAIATNQELPIPSTLHLNDSVQLCHSDC